MDANGAGELNDANALAFISVTHMSPDAGPVDLVEADEGQIWTADYLDTTGVCGIDAGDYSFSVESAGEAVLEGDLSFDAASYSTVIADGLAVDDDLALNVLHDDNRSVASYSKQRFYHGSPSIGDVDIYVVLTGTDITAEDPTVEAVSFRDSTGYLLFDEDNYDIIVTATGEKDELAIVADYMFGNSFAETHMIGDDPLGGTDYVVVSIVEDEYSCVVGNGA